MVLHAAAMHPVNPWPYPGIRDSRRGRPAPWPGMRPSSWIRSSRAHDLNKARRPANSAYLMFGMNREGSSRHLQNVIDIAGFIACGRRRVHSTGPADQSFIAAMTAGRVAVMQRDGIPKESSCLAVGFFRRRRCSALASRAVSEPAYCRADHPEYLTSAPASMTA